MPDQLELPMKPRERVRLPIDPHDNLERTDWETNEDPPTSGYWEVCDNAHTKEAVWWWDEVRKDWWVGVRSIDTRSMHMPANVFRGTHSWRGLKAPSPLVYPTPPYVTTELVRRAQEAGVALRTHYVSVTPAPLRERARL